MWVYLDPQIERILRDGLRREGWPARAKVVPSDRGGLTRGGITAENWGDFKQLGRPATAAELDAITETEALQFYYQRYVALPRFDQVLDQKLRALLIDWAFTSWYDDPTKALQEGLARRGLYGGRIDGELGPKTIVALQADRDPRQLYRDVFAARLRFYTDVAFDTDVDAFLDRYPKSQLHNLKGWQNRCLELLP
jgi:lysozyme family protein